MKSFNGIKLGVKYMDIEKMKIYRTHLFIQNETSTCMGVAYYWEGSSDPFRRLRYRDLDDFKENFKRV